ncbi:hypothetical protein Q4575_08480 [Psychrosphaera sp. 1_MG-2023]|uniref:hypothetical protein n=1 Tax=Psychrosphaera sp. 1_MG-2023 TaxID=3062643 RepID=UPI0026E3C0DA|nr:hypothetical protein [Psychrosphaera sp. 1_MG-2023]MDO6719433.1 hypothetical protein [Psychrosphaera sp. 1_MG-2023]
MNNLNKEIWHCLLPLIFTCSILSGCGSSSESTPDPDPIAQVDTTPDAFVFPAVVAAEPATTVSSSVVTVTGLTASAAISITGGEYAISGGALTSTAGEISNGQTVNIQLTSSELFATTSSATLTIGGVSATFQVTTKAAPASNVQVDINFDTKHVVGGIDTFDRKKFITIHADVTENDWNGGDVHSRNAPNADADVMTNFLEGYDVYLGRNTGAIGWQLSRLKEDASRPGFVDEAQATTFGNDAKWSYSNSSTQKSKNIRAHEHRATDMIIGAQQHPYWPEGTLTGQGWAFSQTDSADEPLGTATGHYMGQFLAKYFDQNPNDARFGQIKPKFVEVMNEPLYDLTTVRSGSDLVPPADIFKFHNTVANEIRKTNSDVLIGGYTVAFPDFDKDNFSRWEQRDKQFIDIAGDNMDFYSIHLYDFPAHQNREKYRKGSNLEATFDLMEQYTQMTLGEVKPFIVSEYGAAIHSMFNQGWSPHRNTLQLRAINSMLMAFLERPNLILKTIPFNVVKAEWGRTTVPYGPRLMVQKFEREGAGAGDEWVYSDLVMFYQLWSDVKGTRIDTHSSDPDVLVDSYVDDNTSYVILNSLEFDDVEIDLNTFGLASNNVTAVEIKHLKTTDAADVASVLETTTLNELPQSVVLGSEATMIIKTTWSDVIAQTECNNEAKYYGDKVTVEIEKNTPITSTINDVVLGEQGEAILRIGLARDHGKSLSPVVTINGTTVTVPNDFRGYDQKNGRNLSGRDNFYGVIEIPVPYSLLSENNEISVNFTDDGGRMASTTLMVFTTTKALPRSN